MSNLGSGPRWMIAISALVLAVWMAGVSAVAWRGLGRNQTKIKNRLARMLTGYGEQITTDPTVPAAPVQLSDSRLSALSAAAGTWRHSTGRPRIVVDQVCLVPDMAAFLEAIGLWDERHFFPILIDEPAWTIPFLRAFRPVRVVRYVAEPRPAPAGAATDLPSWSAGGDGLWPHALEAVARAWCGPGESQLTLLDADRPPRGLGSTPPGLVLASPGSPMLAGAVALAAGRFQPLVGLRLPGNSPAKAGGPARPQQFQDTLSLVEAFRFARRVEMRVGSVVPRYKELGDDCDFVTIAGDWPYRYSYDQANDPLRGIYALDDLIGRVIDTTSRSGWMNQARRRWAFTGRLLGDSAASVARAMGALFLQPKSALLWNTYGDGKPWSEYAMGAADAELRRAISGTESVMLQAGDRADLASWHRTVDPVSRSGMVLFNSSGGPDWFSINGGTGRPSDIPRGPPASVAMIHSFSAADPSDPQTIAGRWLAQGAFAYFGSVNEPYLAAFRTPRLVAALLTAEIPFVAALRQGEHEAFGVPWRLVYLGDPLYRLQNAPLSPDQPSAKDVRQGEQTTDRLLPGEWRKLAADYDNWPVVEIASSDAASIKTVQGRVFDSESDRFRWCLDAAVGELRAPRSDGVSFKTPDPPHAATRALPADGWRSVLREIHRDRLDRELRPFFDELLIDALAESGALEELMTRLARIPSGERGTRVWQGIETSAMQRLAQMSDDRDAARGFGQALDLWDEVLKLGWPHGSSFPSHFSERVGTLALADKERIRRWLDRLRKAAEAMAAEPSRNPHAAVIETEQARATAQLGGLGSSR